MEARLSGLELSSREIARDCAGLRRRVSRALTRAGQVAAMLKAEKKARERDAQRQANTAATASAAEGGPGLQYTEVDPATWPDYFSEDELSAAVKVRLITLRACAHRPCHITCTDTCMDHAHTTCSQLMHAAFAHASKRAAPRCMQCCLFLDLVMRIQLQ
jgi:hypothetical protein